MASTSRELLGTAIIALVAFAMIIIIPLIFGGLFLSATMLLWALQFSMLFSLISIILIAGILLYNRLRQADSESQ